MRTTCQPDLNSEFVHKDLEIYLRGRCRVVRIQYCKGTFIITRGPYASAILDQQCREYEAIGGRSALSPALAVDGEEPWIIDTLRGWHEQMASLPSRIYKANEKREREWLKETGISLQQRNVARVSGLKSTTTRLSTKWHAIHHAIPATTSPYGCVFGMAGDFTLKKTIRKANGKERYVLCTRSSRLLQDGSDEKEILMNNNKGLWRCVWACR